MVFGIFNVYTSYVYSIKCDVNYTYFSDKNALIPVILFIFVILLVLFTRIAQYKMMYGSYVMKMGFMLCNPFYLFLITRLFVWIIFKEEWLVTNFYNYPFRFSNFLSFAEHFPNSPFSLLTKFYCQEDENGMDISNKNVIISNESYIPWYNSKNADKSRKALNKMLYFCKEKNLHLADYLIENCSDLLVKPSKNTGILKSSIEPYSISNYANLSNLEDILDHFQISRINLLYTVLPIWKIVW